MIGDDRLYLKEGTEVFISSRTMGRSWAWTCRSSVDLRVTSTEPGFAGDTATGAKKPATLETGLVVQVPLFVNEGDTLRVDTRNGDYMTRVCRLADDARSTWLISTRRPTLWQAHAPARGSWASPISTAVSVHCWTATQRSPTSGWRARSRPPSFPPSGHCFFTLKDSGSPDQGGHVPRGAGSRRRSAASTGWR